ncbi:MAG: carbamoyltransferase HypF [bacterium]
MVRYLVKIKGIVQGVGFRPFVYRLSNHLNLTGFVRNTSSGVEIEIQGAANQIREFFKKLISDKPRASIIENIETRKISARKNEKYFVIKESKTAAGFTQISPDIATCAECLEEFNNPNDRRYKFPFINCTNCGPRYSIIYNTPYDREKTSMKEFVMCPDCQREFKEITNRRFHAQPDCCFECGPEFSLYKINGTKINTNNPIAEATNLLKKGKIIAIKGIGGFHISCDATNSRAVRKLRILKNRPTKPFAIMTEEKNLSKIVRVSREEREIIKSPPATIMLLPKKKRIICEEVAPNNPYLGVMLPYAPVHYLLMEKIPYLVMTSANVADEPLVKEDKEVQTRLKNMVSFYLTHNRDIINRCDDSVGFYLKKHGFSIIRRSRGYVPVPIELPFKVRPTLAFGPYLKNTFTLADNNAAYMSPHIGDLDNMETLNFFNEMIEKYQRWFKIEPELVVYDLHPDYLSTKLAFEIAKTRQLEMVGVQHHIAHIISCLAEHKVLDRVIGIAFDGTGYGLDGKIWGSEFFIGDMKKLTRIAHLEYLPLPGAEDSIKKPYRIAFAYLYKLFGYLPDYPACSEKGSKKIFPIKMPSDEVNAIRQMIDKEYNLAYTSSMGRLFDCVSAMLGITREITYEAEAAINLEYIAKKGIRSSYHYQIAEINSVPLKKQGESNDSISPMIILIRDLLEGIIKDLQNGVSKNIISAKFHNTVCQFSLDIAQKLRNMYGMDKVVLSGGVFQNRYLLNLMIDKLQHNNFQVYIHKNLPTNDGCISYGQVVAGNSACLPQNRV